MAITLTKTNLTMPDGRSFGTGQLIQSAFARVGPTRQTINSLVPLAITGLSISFTPLSPTSTILIAGYVCHSDTYVNNFTVYKGSASMVSTTGFNNLGAPDSLITQIRTADTVGAYLMTTRVTAYDIAGTTAARTYAIYANSEWNGTAYPLYVNDRNTSNMASFSYMHIFEYETNQ